MSAPADSPIGVFDSGVGGLSVLRALRACLADERFIYYADNAYCPYGGRPDHEIQQRAEFVSTQLLQKNCKLVVVACNTATIAAIAGLRQKHPDVPFVGMEPAVKPACAQTRSGVVGVLATGAALSGDKFLRLVADHARDVRVVTQPCPGLVECVEAGELDGARVRGLLETYLAPLTAAGADVIVLGCTHYPFLRPVIEQMLGPQVTVLDANAAVARQTRRILDQFGLRAASGGGSTLEILASGESDAIKGFLPLID